ncbi:MAG TPA: pentapeptide repeat-containing protein, partial [Novosphingobium sp.]|nr:pentapeptide repeat-containing protein [Novosphingobium sp.]
DLRGADLRDADLSGADLRDADLSGAPIIAQIHQRVYEAASQPNALNMSDWHTCDTTHCRAGWVVALAGDEGKALEKRIGTPAAATLIYLASDPTLEKFPSFYCDDATALADMKRLAELEAAA